VIIKLLRNNDELTLLEYFSKFRERENRTIPLLKVIPLDIGRTMIAFPPTALCLFVPNSFAAWLSCTSTTLPIGI
jgi:hypothetical protein